MPIPYAAALVISASPPTLEAYPVATPLLVPQPFNIEDAPPVARPYIDPIDAAPLGNPE